MLGDISKHFLFMETHVVRKHVNFQNLFDFSHHIKPKCHLDMYLSYALQQWPKVILTKKSY